jgi:hypothetical protein
MDCSAVNGIGVVDYPEQIEILFPFQNLLSFLISQRDFSHLSVPHVTREQGVAVPEQVCWHGFRELNIIRERAYQGAHFDSRVSKESWTFPEITHVYPHRERLAKFGGGQLAQ